VRESDIGGSGLSVQTDLKALQSKLPAVQRRKAVDDFSPNAGGQELFFRSIAHEIILAGGNSSGKTYCGVMNCAWHILPEIDKNGRATGKTIHPYKDIRIPHAGIEGWISTYSQDTQRDTIRPVYDKILGPYMVDKYEEDGVYKRVFFQGIKGRSWINFKWVTQGLSVFKGPKKAFVYMDEPHPGSIYREARARLFRSGGYMWTCLTPIVDDDVRSEDVLWMRDMVEKWERNPEKYPIQKVIYVDVEENYDYVPGELIDAMLASMSDQERLIRGKGLFMIFSGRNCFNKEKVLTILNYLEKHPEESTPEYGHIIWDVNEDDEWKAEFVPDENIMEFEDKPQNEWMIKVWERPVPGTGLQLCPEYLITVDAAEGVVGGDYTNAYVFRKDNRRIVAALHGHISEDELAKQLWLLGHYYNDGAPDYDPAELAIEVRTYGASTQRYLITGSTELSIPKYPYHKIYQRPTPADMAQDKEYAFAPGWDTNARTRNFLIIAMRQAITLAFKSIEQGHQCIIPDIGLLKEAREFVMNKKGKYEGRPDDRLFALGIAHFILADDSYSYLLPKTDEPAGPDPSVTFNVEQLQSGLVTISLNIPGIMEKFKNQSGSGELRF